MSHEARFVVLECDVAENMVDVHVRIDDVADRQGRESSDRGSQCAPDRHRPAGVDNRHAGFAHDKADVGNIIVAGYVQRQLSATVQKMPGASCSRLKVPGVSAAAAVIHPASNRINAWLRTAPPRSAQRGML